MGTFKLLGNEADRKSMDDICIKCVNSLITKCGIIAEPRESQMEGYKLALELKGKKNAHGVNKFGDTIILRNDCVPCADLVNYVTITMKDPTALKILSTWTNRT